jgi:ligand-binding sensor domain-containing protein
MKVFRIAVMLLVGAAVVFAGDQKHETKVDSMSYETDTEWRIFQTGGAVHGFALSGSVIWSITEGGITALNTAGGKKVDLQTYKDLGGVPAADATCIAVDNAGFTWVGTKAGLAMKTKDSFKVFTKDNGLADNMVNKLLAAHGKVWVATDNGVSVYSGGAWTSYNVKDGLAGEKVRDIVIGEGGLVWFGTNKGISRFDGTAWTTYNMKNGLSWNDTHALAYDAKTHTLWAAVGDKDINAFDGKAWKVFMEVAEGTVAIMADTQSRIWIATASGLMKFNGDEWVSDPQKIGITATQVSQMYRDDKGNLWFGMEQGVLKLDNPYPY